MKRNLLGLALALSLVFALTGCTSDKAPNVTPSPSTSVAPSVTPSATPSTINMPYHFTSMPKTRNATGSMNRIPPYARTSKSQATEPERTSCMRRFTG